MRRIWLILAQLSFPYFVVSAGVTPMVNTVSRHAGWKLALAAFPVMFCVYRSFQLYFESAGKLFATPSLARRAVAGR
jgi:hypothetical protein